MQQGVCEDCKNSKGVRELITGVFVNARYLQQSHTTDSPPPTCEETRHYQTDKTCVLTAVCACSDDNKIRECGDSNMSALYHTSTRSMSHRVSRVWTLTGVLTLCNEAVKYS